ncbi:uncharacterized protein DS421_19g664300 [Arachis hypogaea]|uniref:Uncharacterized protein n=1 Tax=Arachis hypogaea TaxID=3818 RepID=A0A6B9VDK5_ARAHY|nr:uncharacterized protein DS421_19g664300 [Arachis hypogaea]
MGSGGGLDKREEECECPSHEVPGNHAFLPGWAQGQQSAASPIVVSSFLTNSIGKRGKGDVGLEELAVQGRRDIASKQQVLLSRADYNKIATLI